MESFATDWLVGLVIMGMAAVFFAWLADHT